MKHKAIFLSRIVCLATGLLTVYAFAFAQTFRAVGGWPDSVNSRLEDFLNSTLVIRERKVAVFDCDGTLFGQAPHYLADEALYSYAETYYAGKKDRTSKQKMKIVETMLHGNNTGMQYVKERIAFLSGMSTEQVERLGEDCFRAKYRSKFYPQMRTLLADLEAYGFEVWVVSASPELLYQGFVHEALGIPVERILGVRSVVRNDTVTATLVYPVPQDAGKAEVIQTFIKARPLFAAGNSRGDMEMMNQSAGLKMIVNPDGQVVQKGKEAGGMQGYTVRGYWLKKGAILVHCRDVPLGRYHYVSDDWGVPDNGRNP
jgi:phosphoserine phosphatase